MSVLVQDYNIEKFGIRRSDNAVKENLKWDYAKQVAGTQGYALEKAEGKFVISDLGGHAKLPEAADGISANDFLGFENKGNARVLFRGTNRNDQKASAKVTIVDGQYLGEWDIASCVEGPLAKGDYVGVICADDATAGKLKKLPHDPYAAIAGAAATEAVAIYGQVKAVESGKAKIAIYSNPEVVQVVNAVP